MPTLLRVRTRLPANTLCELAARVTCVVSGVSVSREGVLRVSSGARTRDASPCERPHSNPFDYDLRSDETTR